MGTWEKQQEAKKEAKERDKTRREKLAGYFFNLSQLTYTGLVLGGMVLFFQGSEFTFKLGVMLALGCLLAYLMAIIGNNLFK
ncbi:MAG TPA: hypothetical protein H9785_08630 [Candidatus Bacteroides intestinavium]|uniref:Uncharacterized protein n=1 Tax=Candidatus Bacteroides intestinavium TaxID=2838469 RepID=A0A9D2KT78_9BACE|nr:hypothetical protein [Candidatus Bacteroides intestinavium]